MLRWYMSLAIVVAVAGCASTPVTWPGPDAEAARKAVQARLDAVALRAAEAAEALAKMPFDSPDARAILAEIAESEAGVIDCAVVTPEGRMAVIEPAEFKAAEGADISGQTHIGKLLATHQPVLSEVFLAVEGFRAIDLEAPIFDGQGTYLGSVSLLMNPATLIDSAVRPLFADTAVSCWVMETGGTILYDVDPQEVGRNVLEDDLYASFETLRTLAQQMRIEGEGSGFYRFMKSGLGMATEKQCFWKTAGLYGTEWRVIVTQDVN